MAKFKEQATQEYDASYNQKVQALKNQLAQNQQTLEQQKGGVNSNYDLQVSNQNLSNKKSMNTISNSALGRGMGNSSIVTSGLAESDQINNRMVGNINNQRTGDLNNIDQQKSLLAQNMEGTLSTMSADRLDGISTLARQLEDRDFDKTHQTNQLDLQREKMLADQQYNNLSLAQQKELANAELAWNRENAGNQLAWEREKLAQTLAYSGSGGSGGRSNSDSGDGYDQAYNEYLSKYSEIMSRDDLTNTQKNNMLKSLKTEMNLFTSKYGLNYGDLNKQIGMGVTTANGVTLNYDQGITKSATTTTSSAPNKTSRPKNQNTLTGKIANYFKKK